MQDILQALAPGCMAENKRGQFLSRNTACAIDNRLTEGGENLGCSGFSGGSNTVSDCIGINDGDAVPGETLRDRGLAAAYTAGERNPEHPDQTRMS